MVEQESRTIRISQETYDYLDTRAERGSETFNQIIRRLLKIK